MHEDWHQDTLERSWICTTDSVAFTKQPGYNPASGFLGPPGERRPRRERRCRMHDEPERIIHGTRRRRSVIISLHSSTGPVIDARLSAKIVAPVNERIKQNGMPSFRCEISNMRDDSPSGVTCLMNHLRF